MSKFSTDAIRPSALPSASLGRRGGDTALSGNSEKEALEKEYQAWNVRIDTEVKSLSSGLKELVQLANIKSDPPAHTTTKTPLDLQIRTSQIIRSTQNLRDIAHDLKLAFLLSNQVELATKRDDEMRVVRREVGVRRGEVSGEVARLLERQLGTAAGPSNEFGQERSGAETLDSGRGDGESDDDEMEVVGGEDRGVWDDMGSGDNVGIVEDVGGAGDVGVEAGTVVLSTETSTETGKAPGPDAGDAELDQYEMVEAEEATGARESQEGETGDVPAQGQDEHGTTKDEKSIEETRDLGAQDDTEHEERREGAATDNENIDPQSATVDVVQNEPTQVLDKEEATIDRQGIQPEVVPTTETAAGSASVAQADNGDDEDEELDDVPIPTATGEAEKGLGTAVGTPASSGPVISPSRVPNEDDDDEDEDMEEVS